MNTPNVISVADSDRQDAVIPVSKLWGRFTSSAATIVNKGLGYTPLSGAVKMVIEAAKVTGAAANRIRGTY